MTMQAAPEMSVAHRNFETKEELREEAQTMTATTMNAAVTHYDTAAYGTRRVRPHGLDLLVMRLSLATLLWARRRADRNLMTHEENMLRRAVEMELGDRADR